MTMPGRDPVSVLRSFKRFLSLVLPEDWDIQLVRREPQTRPLAVVRFIGPAPSVGTAYLRRYTQSVEVLLYPAGREADPVYGEVEARSAQHLVERAIDSGHAAAGSFAMRVPLFDYTEVELAPASTDPQDIALAELPIDAVPLDYLVVTDLTGQTLPDPEQDDMFTVTIDLRVMWSDDGDRSRFDGPTLEQVSVGNHDWLP